MTTKIFSMATWPLFRSADSLTAYCDNTVIESYSAGGQILKIVSTIGGFLTIPAWRAKHAWLLVGARAAWRAGRGGGCSLRASRLSSAV